MQFTGTIEPEVAKELDAMLGALAKPDGPMDDRHPTQRPQRHHGLHPLLDGVGTATLEGGALLSAAAARRIACDCGVVPVVMGANQCRWMWAAPAAW